MDKKFIAGLITGVVLTLIVFKQAQSRDVALEAPRELKTREEQTQDLKPVVENAKPSRPVELKSGSKVAKMELTAIPPSVTNLEEKPGRQITLNSQVIQEMEDAWNDLGQQIRLRKEPEGLRIIELKSHSIFARAGFVQGELITNNAVEGLRRISVGDQQLPERFERVLNHVTW